MRERKALKVSPIELCSEAKISISTLYGVFSDRPSVREKSRKKVSDALDRFRERRASADRSQTS
jgi:DNA-binding LacI/PurR family transcriptional regulator